jgi:DNA-binding response OmpR family regulator
MRILLVEDNHRLNDSLKLSLTEDGYAVDAAFNGPDGEELAGLAPYDAIILDVMLPGKDGMAVCRDIRSNNIHTPVLMLTARDTVDDRVQGLDSGADDYLVKPFALSELRARLRALLRRDSPNKSAVLQVGDLTLDPATHQVERSGQLIELTTREFSFLEYLMRNPNRLVTREMVEEHLWSYDYEGASNVVDVYVRRLRRKIDDPFETKLLETVRGAGYRLYDPSQKKDVK